MGHCTEHGLSCLFKQMKPDSQALVRCHLSTSPKLALTHESSALLLHSARDVVNQPFQHSLSMCTVRLAIDCADICEFITSAKCRR